MRKRIIAALLAACLCLMLCGCGGEKYPSMRCVDISNLSLSEASNSVMSLRYPDELWYGADDTDPLIIYYRSTMGTDQVININAQKLSECRTAPTEQDMKDIVDGVQEMYVSIDIKDAELRDLNGSTVIYMEGTFSFTDDVIDLVLESGKWTQADLDAMGGREVLLALPPTEQMFLYLVKDGWLYLYTGTYFDEQHHDMVLDTITVLAQTTESVG